MKVIKGIDKGNNSTKELEYTNDWGKVIKDDKVIQKLKKLQSLISNTSEEGNFEQMQKEAFRLRKSLFDHNKPPSTILNGVRDDIYKITLLGKRGKTKRDKAIVINHPTMIDFIIASFYSKLHTFAQAPTNGKPISNLKKLLSNGGYEIILELQKTLSNQFLFDFMNESVKTQIYYGDNFDKIGWQSKIQITSLDSFKQSLSEYKKERKSK